jgi:predicted  nucleic acid-binding Zn-ribbon protein
MEQQLDAFTQRRFELMVEMATKKLYQEMEELKNRVFSLQSEIGSLKSQFARAQFQQQSQSQPYKPAAEQQEQPEKKDVKIVDCRPNGEKKSEFVSGAAKNSEPVMPRFGEYKSEDVSIDKFFYFGRK